MLGSVDWWLITDASVQPFGPIIQVQAAQENPIGCPKTSVTNIVLLKP